MIAYDYFKYINIFHKVECKDYNTPYSQIFGPVT